jgi:hypothetical protein
LSAGPGAGKIDPLPRRAKPQKPAPKYASGPPPVLPDPAQLREKARAILAGPRIADAVCALEAGLRGHALELWIERDGASAVMKALAQRAVPLVADALARAPAGSIGWADVAPIAERGLAALDALILPHARDVYQPACRKFLVAVVVRATDPDSSVHVMRTELVRSLAADALGALEPCLEPGTERDEVLAPLLETAERVVARFDPERPDPAMHELVGRVARLRRRLGARDPRGWLGAVLTVRGAPPIVLVEHTRPDATSTVVLAAGGPAPVHLRAPAHELRDLAAAMADPMFARALAALGPGRALGVDPRDLRVALDRTVPPNAALAEDVAHLAAHASQLAVPLTAEYVEGWWEPTSSIAERATDVDD